MPESSPYQALLAAVPVSVEAVSVLGRRTSYRVYGEPDAGTTVVLVHGYRGDHHGLEPVVAHLRGLRLISPDLPGFGDSEPFSDRRHTVEEYAVWLDAFVTEVGVRGDAVILGHSFGTIVSAFAVADGLPTPRMVLVNPIAAPALEGPKGILSRLTMLYYRTARALPQRIGHALLASPIIVRIMSLAMVQTREPRLRRWIHEEHDRYFSVYGSRDSVVEGFEASISHDVSMVASRIEVPTLLIGADRDPIATVESQQRLADLFPDAHLELLRGVGHLVHYEKPLEAARALVDFLGAGTVVESPRS
jgi:pimeloyl-ACP methyl ester carboxylesterase